MSAIAAHRGGAGVRRLLLILGDQLDRGNPALAGCDPRHDLVWLCEAAEEATLVPSHKARITLFFSSMRHFADTLRRDGLPVRYLALDQHHHPSLGAALAADLAELAPEHACVMQPGEHRVLEALRAACRTAAVPLAVLADPRFLCPGAAFAQWADGRRTFRLQDFYRWLRRREGVLVEDGRPLGGAWSFDKDNRRAFGKAGPGALARPLGFTPDATTRAVIGLVRKRFPDAPGTLEHFDWPVTAAEADAALEDFVEHRLAAFGPFQDAMWSGEPYLHHARLSAALNLGLLAPRRAVDAAVAAYAQGAAPIASVEGFVRQILGWREFVRGLYWREMPAYLARNALAADQPLPAFYWTGETGAACLRETIGQILAHGYAHHIQRLMVTGLFALLLGVRPQQVHQWYLAMFVDAVEWVEAPNTLGMSQFADGGLLASKPYAASGAYIDRMSDYCRHCRYDPAKAEGDAACPFTTLFWDFLARHRERFANHPRSGPMWRNLDRVDRDRLRAIRAAADRLRDQVERI